MQQGQADRPVPFPESKDTLVVWDTAGIKRFDLFALRSGRFAIRSHPSKGLLSEIGRQAKASTHGIVQHGLHAHDISNAWREVRMDERAGLGKNAQGRVNVRALIVRWLDFANQR